MGWLVSGIFDLGIFAKLDTPWGCGRCVIFTKTSRKSTNWIKGFIGHQKFLVSDNYEQSYSSLKLVENPKFPDLELKGGLARKVLTKSTQQPADQCALEGRTIIRTD